MNNEPVKQTEAKYKLSWIEDHLGADEVIYDPKTNQPVNATYFYPPYHHEQEIKAIFNGIERLSDE